MAVRLWAGGGGYIIGITSSGAYHPSFIIIIVTPQRSAALFRGSPRRENLKKRKQNTSSLLFNFVCGLCGLFCASLIDGTVYPVPSTGVMTYSNVDGGRINDGRYDAFKADITRSLIPEERVYTDPVKTFAYGRAKVFWFFNPTHTKNSFATLSPRIPPNRIPPNRMSPRTCGDASRAMCVRVCVSRERL